MHPLYMYFHQALIEITPENTAKIRSKLVPNTFYHVMNIGLCLDLNELIWITLHNTETKVGNEINSHHKQNWLRNKKRFSILFNNILINIVFKPRPHQRYVKTIRWSHKKKLCCNIILLVVLSQNIWWLNCMNCQQSSYLFYWLLRRGSFSALWLPKNVGVSFQTVRMHLNTC